jgi:hypothetical protein
VSVPAAVRSKQHATEQRGCNPAGGTVSVPAVVHNKPSASEPMPVHADKTTTKPKFDAQEFLNVVSEIQTQNNIHAVSEMHGPWERIQVIIDSGSNVPVMPVALAEKYKVTESRASKAGVSYAVANGNQIPNLGEKFFPVVTKEGTLRGYQSQCADVTSVLQSVNHLNDTNHGVWLDGKNSFMVNKLTREVNRIDHDGRNFTQELWVVPPEELSSVAEAINETGFIRHP